MGDRNGAIARVEDAFDNGAFFDVLNERIKIESTSQEPERAPELARYLHENIGPALEKELACTWEVFPNPVDAGPLLIAERHEGDSLPTVLVYGHGDTVRGQDESWGDGLKPWEITVEGDRWYGRGTADNKGQHTINFAALAAVLEERGSLGFNLRVLVETGEEMGSKGLREFAAANKDKLRADVLIASDGPRVQADRPTIFLGSRGNTNFSLTINARDGGHHSGNWGGLISNPAVQLVNAISTLVDGKGRLQLDALKPPPISNAVRAALADLEVDGGPGAPVIEPEWGAAGLTPNERVFAWNTVEILAMESGNPAAPVNAIPPSAMAVCQIRFVAGSDYEAFLPAIQAHLVANGYDMIEAAPTRGAMAATRTPLDDPWVDRALASLAKTTGEKPALLPSLGGSIPNDVFTDTLGMPTIWVPHSYAGCSQHAPDEHALGPTLRSGLRVMAGLFWDVGALSR
jgi:acetylornithine deacetylase/succinyl-diaminopimelate desuccinylase-like protein